MIGIGIYQTKTGVNIGTLWRSAFIYDADFIFTIGKRYKTQASDTYKTYRHIPLYHYINFEDFNSHRPHGAKLIGVELNDNAIKLDSYKHPRQAIYLLGAEDNGIPDNILNQCQDVITIPSTVDHCLNVATAGSIVLYDRFTKKESTNDNN